jgi:hypothetical protein
LKDKIGKKFAEAIVADDLIVVGELINKKELEIYLTNGYAIYEASRSSSVNVLSLLFKYIKPENKDHFSFIMIEALRIKNFSVVNVFLNNNINLEESSNEAIIVAYNLKEMEVVNKIWKNNKVRKSLKKDDLNLYNFLIKKKIENF